MLAAVARTKAVAEIGGPATAKTLSDDEVAEKSGPQSARESGHARRDLTHEDVGKVILGFKQLGPENFLKGFMRSQRVAMQQPGKSITPVMREYFMSLELLRKALFPDVNLRRSGHLFGDLTMALDQAMMRSIAYLPDIAAPFSINLNVQSVFTKNFEVFIGRAPLDLLTIEFRQTNIVEFYDEFVTARELLRDKGVRIAVDQIFPDTLGLVNLDFLGASMAKLHWGEGAADILKERQHAFAHILETGIGLVMTHVDEAAALTVGASMGIRQFQGYLVENLIKKAAA